MPRICEFYGIVIAMYYSDHDPPHFHAVYAEHEALLAIGDHRVLRGRLPRRALRLVREWAKLHDDELLDNWRRARRKMPLAKLKPLP